MSTGNLRFIICFLLDFVFSIFLFCLLNLLCLLFFVLKFALPYKLSHLNVMCRHRKQTSIWLDGFILNVFHLRQFLHQSVNLGDSFLDNICQLACICKALQDFPAWNVQQVPREKCGTEKGCSLTSWAQEGGVSLWECTITLCHSCQWMWSLRWFAGADYPRKRNGSSVTSSNVFSGR